MKKRAFTLAEVMITIGVIGVLAAILIPAIMNLQPDPNRIMFKKAYYITERVVNDIVNDISLYPDSDTTPDFINEDSVTVGGKAYSGTSKFCELFARKVNTAGTVSCTSAKSTPASGSTGLNSGNFVSNDGVTWHIPIQSFTTTTPIVITVDTNGTSAKTTKSPNCTYNATTCKKPDQFQISVEYDGKITVSGTKEIEYLKNVTVNSGS